MTCADATNGQFARPVAAIGPSTRPGGAVGAFIDVELAASARDASPDLDEVQICDRVARLFARAVDRATGGASACVDNAMAARLASSIEAVLACGGFLGAEPDPDVAFERGCVRFSDAMRSCEPLWRAVCTTMPPELRNVSLRDTLASIEGCWLRYDPRLFANEAPCDIDYQLCRPVEKGLPEEGGPLAEKDPLSEKALPADPAGSADLAGPFYLRAYLRRLLVEARLLARFDPRDEIALLEASCPDWRGLHVNLYEPVAACALGRELLEGAAEGPDGTGENTGGVGEKPVFAPDHAAPFRLALTRADQDALVALFGAGRGSAAAPGAASRPVARTRELRDLLRKAAHGAAARLGLAPDEAVYLAAYADDLVARLAVGGVRGVFPISA